jgi:hypothetical protein
VNNNAGTYSRTITTDPENAGLLNHLVDRYVLPVLHRNIAQGAMQRSRTSSKKTPEQELEAILNFGMSKPTTRVQSTRIATAKNVAQGGLNTTELRNFERLLEFGGKKM